MWYHYIVILIPYLYVFFYEMQAVYHGSTTLSVESNSKTPADSHLSEYNYNYVLLHFSSITHKSHCHW